MGKAWEGNFWYVIPSRIGLKTKEEVSDLLITDTPERQHVTEPDKPLISYLRGAKDVPLARFEADMRRLVASGANLNRCHVLIRAVMNGVTSEAKLRLLVRMGLIRTTQTSLRKPPSTRRWS